MTGSGIATVARQEFRLRIRAGRWRILLGTWFGVLLLFTALLRVSVDSFTGTVVDQKGVVIYGGLMLLVLGLALLVVPALAAQSVNGDRERGTLATLQVTRLSASEIALGKFAAAWVTSLVFLALTLPLVGYAMTQGGVPLGRALIVTLVIALLLGTVCAVSLALSALLARTTTSGVLAYLSVFGLTLGTLIVFGLVTAVTTEKFTETFTNECPTLEQLPPDIPLSEREQIVRDCDPSPQSYESSRARTDRTWFLLAPNPFVVLADAAPQLPEETAAERVRREADEQRGVFRQSARDVDPLGQIGSEVRQLRVDPGPLPVGGFTQETQPDERKPVWPTGLAVNVALAALSLLITTRRLRTPSTKLPRGQRVA